MDLEVFELLCGIHDEQISNRLNASLSVEDIVQYGSETQRAALLEERPGSLGLKKLPKELRLELMATIIASMPYQVRVDKILRPEEVLGKLLTTTQLDRINHHLGTCATSLTEIVEQVGIMRFGHRPQVCDTFSGGGSISFASARLGCDTFASDLNPIACMLTWGALNIIGASELRLHRDRNSTGKSRCDCRRRNHSARH